ncbi:MAG: dihydrolipoyl dehydrogenase [Candidatus Cloacimonetes bacterium]|nr:dihydrolipoyl dehydrogenase [Candidatus Cloacimonadota bacterium]
MENNFKVAIIGAGPGGYETAIRLNQLGISVVCFEKERVGGVCLNKGCIPTKTLVTSADLYHKMKTGEDYGLENCDFAISYDKIYKRKCQTVEKLVSGIEYLFKKRNIPLLKYVVTKIEKEGSVYKLFTSESSEIYTCDYVIIATGSQPRPLPFLPVDGSKVLSSDNILELNSLPKSLIIVGGGVIGCEFACIYHQLGVAVTVVEFLPELVSTEDEEVSKKLSLALKKSGIKIITKTAVVSGEVSNDHISLTLKSNVDEVVSTITAQQVLVSIGRKPVFDIITEGFDLEMSKEMITINDFCQTNEENIFAIGDVTGKLMLAHTASKQGLLVADYINSKVKSTTMTLKTINYRNIPSCIFTTPEIASCGCNEQQAMAESIPYKIGRFHFAANGKALASGASLGFVKTIINAETDQIIGMHIIGYLATELIAQASILINTGAKASDVANIVFAHPTISECVMEAIEDTHKLAIHTL